MRHILLTWNPGSQNDGQWSPEEWEVDMVAGTANGHSLDRRWSVAKQHVRRIAPGDRAYLFRQGQHGRGLVALGEVTSEPFADDSWNGGGSAQYVHVTWIEALPLDQRLDITVLKAEVPGFGWDTVYSSGREVKECGAVLDGLWRRSASEATPLEPVLQGAGYGTAEQNRRVEKAAIQYVTDAYEAEGYAVASVEAAHCGWDLTAVRGADELHLEVKGVSGSLVQFFLTANEYETALEDPEWLLVIVTDALSEPLWHEMDGPTAASYAEPAMYQVRVPEEAFVE